MIFRPLVRLILGGVVILAILLTLATCQGDTKFDTHCGAWAEDTVTQKLMDNAEKGGTNLRTKLFESTDPAAVALRTHTWMGSFKMRTLATVLSFLHSAKNQPAPAVATGIRIRTEEAQAAAVAACCPSVPAPPPQTPVTPPSNPGPPVDLLTKNGQGSTKPPSKTSDSIHGLAQSLGGGWTLHRDPLGKPSVDIATHSLAQNSRIAEAMRANHAKFKLDYVISQERIASGTYNNWGWRRYTRRALGDWRHNHHVHVTYTKASPLEAQGRGGSAPPLTVKGVPATKAQLAQAAVIVDEANRRGLGRHAAETAVTVSIFEAVLGNPKGGDRDSVGAFQQRAGWGPYSVRHNVRKSAGLFYDAMVKVKGWRSRSIDNLAQAVQRSASGNYQDYDEEGKAIVSAISNSPNVGPVPKQPTINTPDPARPTTPLVPPGAQAHVVPPANPACVGTGAGGAAGGVNTAGQGSVNGLTVGTWNVLFSNSHSNINANAGFADLVGLQEIRDNGAIHVPGYDITDGKMAVPIIWNTARLEIVPWKFPGDKTAQRYHRDTVLTGYARDKSVVYGVWRNKQTGKLFAAMNSHLLVQGGAGWAEQAARLNKVRAMLEAEGLPVVFVGDFNAPVSKISATFGGAMAGSRLDQVLSFGAKPAHEEILSKEGSDHHRIRVTFTGGKLYPSGPVAQPKVAPTAWDSWNPRTVSEAVAAMRHFDAVDGGGKKGVAGHCEAYMNYAYGLSGGYDSAHQHWLAPGPRHSDVDAAPAGALIFFDTPQGRKKADYDHVVFSLGQGRAISTDYTKGHYAKGKIGEGSIAQISRAMGGTPLGWRAPNFNQGKAL